MIRIMIAIYKFSQPLGFLRCVTISSSILSCSRQLRVLADGVLFAPVVSVPNSCLLSASIRLSSTPGVSSGVNRPVFWTYLPDPGLLFVPRLIALGFYGLDRLADRLPIFASIELTINRLTKLQILKLQRLLVIYH